MAELREKQLKALEEIFPSLMKAFEPKDVIPTLVARCFFGSADMTLIYSQGSRQDRVRKFIEILKSKSNWWCPLVDALIRTGQTQTAEKLISMAQCQNTVIACNGDVKNGPVTCPEAV